MPGWTNPTPEARDPGPATGQQPVFRSGVQIVEVDVRVFDRDDRFVADLTRDDFELLENGVPQQLYAVYLVGVPDPKVQDPSRGTRDPRPSSGVLPAAPARHTWIFVFDLNHLVPGAAFGRAQQAIEELIRTRLNPGDLAGVVAGSRMVNNRLTSVREELIEAVRSVKPQPEPRSRQADMTREWPRFRNEMEVLSVANEERDAIERVVLRACTEEPDQCSQVPPDLAVRQKARRLAGLIERAATETLTSINALASGLAKMPGSKTIVFLSEGFVVQRLETHLRTVVGQTARAGARVYAIDMRGLSRGSGGGPDQMLAAHEVAGPPDVDLKEDGPNSLAVGTGGLMIRNESNLARALDRIADDSGRYYVLAYQPASGAFDGTFRSIEVRVKRPELRVRARRGYLALEPAKMLVPRPVTGGSGIRDPGSASDARPEPEGGIPKPVTAPGTVVAGPTPDTAATVRLRPGRSERIRALVESETASAGELAEKGWAAYERGDVESALAALSAAAERPDVRPWVLYVLGFCHVALGRPAEAAAAWERVRRTTPEFDAVYIDLADAYVQLSDTAKALAVLREAETRWPLNPDVHNAIGVIHVRRDALDQAIAAFAKATTVAPTDPLGYFNLARAYQLRFGRSRRYVSSQRRWIADDDDRRRAIEAYQRTVTLGGPYAAQAAEAIKRLEWQK